MRAEAECVGVRSGCGGLIWVRLGTAAFECEIA